MFLLDRDVDMLVRRGDFFHLGKGKLRMTDSFEGVVPLPFRKRRHTTGMRNLRERILQTLGYEVGSLLIVTPLYAILVGKTVAESLALLTVVSLLTMFWSPLYNHFFDWFELNVNGVVASDRPYHWRMVHAVTHEASDTIVTLPAIMWIGGFDFWTAIAVDIGLTLAYATYTYVYHLTFDRLRPVKTREVP